MNFIIAIFYLALSFFGIYKIKMFGAFGINKNWFLLAFSAKLMAAISLWVLFSFYYGDKSKADIFRYFDDSQIAYKQLNQKPLNYLKILTSIDDDNPELKTVYDQMNNWYSSSEYQMTSNNRFIIRYLCLLNLVTFGSYAAINIITVFLSFTGLFWIFRFFYHKMPDKKWWIFIIVFFTPSVLFWTSGILKESLLIFLIGLVINCGNFALKNKKPFLRTIAVIIAIAAILNLKAFAALFLIIALSAYLWNHFRPKQIAFLSYFIVLFVLVSIISESSKFMDKSVYQIVIEKKTNFVDEALHDKSGSLFKNPELLPNTFSFLKNIPVAIGNVIFRPWFWESRNTLNFLAATENFILLILIIFAILFKTNSSINSNLLWFCLVFSISYFSIIGIVSPIFGAISRYRTIPLIFFEMALIQLIDIEKVRLKLRMK